MTGMGGMPDGRPLTMGGWPGEGVRAGDEGRLLYTQHTNGAVIHSKKKKRKERKKREKKATLALSSFHKVILSFKLLL